LGAGLQKLGSHGNRDNPGFLGCSAFAAGNTNRANELRNPLRRKSALDKPPHHARPLGSRSDHAYPRKVIATQGLRSDALVEVMTMRCNQDMIPGLCTCHQAIRRLTTMRLHLRKPPTGSFPCFTETHPMRIDRARHRWPGLTRLACIDPVDTAGNRGKHLHEGLADMTGTVQLQSKTQRRRRPSGDRSVAERGPYEFNRASATLAERGPSASRRRTSRGAQAPA